MRYTLSPEWDIMVPDHFQHRVEGEHAVFWTRGGVTLLCTVFHTPAKRTPNALANLRARAEIRELLTIEDVQGEIVRFAYMQTEELRPGHHRLALHALPPRHTAVCRPRFTWTTRLHFKTSLKFGTQAAITPKARHLISQTERWHKQKGD